LTDWFGLVVNPRRLLRQDESSLICVL